MERCLVVRSGLFDAIDQGRLLGVKRTWGASSQDVRSCDLSGLPKLHGLVACGTVRPRDDFSHCARQVRKDGFGVAPVVSKRTSETKTLSA